MEKAGAAKVEELSVMEAGETDMAVGAMETLATEEVEMEMVVVAMGSMVTERETPSHSRRMRLDLS